jgi:predicted unusual protein kinase regulating ubiquinone biosynthesis (AarF/ABC1/UbiB family)
MRFPILAACYGLFPSGIHLQEESKDSGPAVEAIPKEEAKVVQKPPTVLARVWNLLIHLVRFCQLMIIFAPPILLFPLMFFKRTEGYWMDLFVKAIERSGVVFIKAFQYLSHRRDMIGPELASKFEYLREKAPTHSLSTTIKYFK